MVAARNQFGYPIPKRFNKWRAIANCIGAKPDTQSFPDTPYVGRSATRLHQPFTLRDLVVIFDHTVCANGQ